MITNKKILVAGGNGFIGTNLCAKLLSQMNDVVIVDNFITSKNKFDFWYKAGAKMIQGDIIYPFPLYNMEEHFDIIINLACPASPPHYQKDPTHTLDTCYIGTKNLLNMMDKNTIFLQASTSEVYGDSWNVSQSENDTGNVNCFGPRACYDEGKRIAETLCYEKIKQGYDVKIMRIFNTYGPWMDVDDGRVITNIIKQCLRKEPITIYGTGEQSRSFQYIDDLLKGIELLLESNINEPVNLGNPVEITINKLVNIIKELTDYDGDIVYMDLPEDDPSHRRPDISKAVKELNFNPTINLKEGLQKTINHICLNMNI
jgi:UDP-glucuronate decarboxylase